MIRLVRLLALLLVAPLLHSQQPTIPGDQVVDRAGASVTLILTGGGDGQLAGVASGVIVRSDGVLLTALHAVKGMKELQVRLKTGEIYDNVELIATDERRDIAALRIPAAKLPEIKTRSTAELKPGSSVFSIANGAALPWSVSAGVFSGLRNAEEVPGAGSGFRLLQFTAPIAPGSSGGLLLDAEGNGLGIILGSLTEGQNINFAVPIDSILGLASGTGGTKLGSGAALQMPGISRRGNRAIQQPDASARPTPEDSLSPLTVNIFSKTVYLRRERMQEELLKHPEFKTLGFQLADYGQTANIGITIDRPFMTFDWTYLIVQQPEGVLLASGLIEAEDEYDASPKLAAAILTQFAMLRTVGLHAPARTGAPSTVKPDQVASELGSFKTIYVESHTIYLKGHQLQDALYIRPEIRDWGIKIVDDKSLADVWVNVTRPFLTFDWVYTITDLKSGKLLSKGKVIAWDGPIAAPQLAVEIVKDIRNARPLPVGK